MAPSMSPVFSVRALDVRRSSPPDGHDPTDFLHLRAETDPSAASTASSSGASGTVIGLAVVLSILTVLAATGVWYIIQQRKQLLSMNTVRVLYNVDNLAKDAEANKAGVTVVDLKEKSDSFDVPVAPGDEKLYTIDLSDDKPFKAIPRPAASSETNHVPPAMSLRRKLSRNVARQRLRIIIPAGVSVPDVELVTTATVGARTPNTGVSTAVSTARTTSISRRNTARTPKSALSSAVTALSSAAISIVHRREKVEPVYQSNGWAPAKMVYLPKNPRDQGAAGARSPVTPRRLATARKSARLAPKRANTISIGGGRDNEARRPMM